MHNPGVEKRCLPVKMPGGNTSILLSNNILLANKGPVKNSYRAWLNDRIPTRFYFATKVVTESGGTV